MGKPLIVVLGGTRSGKSTHGLARMTDLAGDRPVAYLATAIVGDRTNDAELAERVDQHRRRRPATWSTLDVGVDLPGAVAAAGPRTPILLDGLTLWLAAVTDSVADDGPGASPDSDATDGPLDGRIADGLAALGGHAAPVVVVSDEIGLGMVPMDAGARAFRDLQGIVHQRLAAIADEVVLVVAGLPLVLKGPVPA
jgi:adenosylcobinamide kinase / adenosylcobinamide-phosphate guanylyltransferase